MKDLRTSGALARLPEGLGPPGGLHLEAACLDCCAIATSSTPRIGPGIWWPAKQCRHRSTRAIHTRRTRCPARWSSCSITALTECRGGSSATRALSRGRWRLAVLRMRPATAAMCRLRWTSSCEPVRSSRSTSARGRCSWLRGRIFHSIGSARRCCMLPQSHRAHMCSWRWRGPAAVGNRCGGERPKRERRTGW